MKFAMLNHNAYMLHLEPDDDILPTIQQFCVGQKITNAKIEGIGSVDNPQLAHYSLQDQAYAEQRLDGTYEITSMLGNVALVDGAPKAHLHVTISDHKMRAGGGHLIGGVCSATIELILTSYPTQFAKVRDPSTGLDTWKF